MSNDSLQHGRLTNDYSPTKFGSREQSPRHHSVLLWVNLHALDERASPDAQHAGHPAAPRVQAEQAVGEAVMDDLRFRRGKTRRGKTRRERASGEATRRANNRDQRAAYTRECKAKAAVSPSSFPLHTSNGQKSRSLKAK